MLEISSLQICIRKFHGMRVRVYVSKMFNMTSIDCYLMYAVQSILLTRIKMLNQSMSVK